MTATGGYFELELNKNSEFHENLIAVNTGRNALEYILKAGNYKKVFIPYYTCSAVLEPLKKLNLNFEYYQINNNLEISKTIQTDNFSVILYINYFGIKSNYISSICSTYPNLIIDNSQAFFHLPGLGVDTFYSCRKFFGVSDGAYLNTKKSLQINLKEDYSQNRIAHLIKRIENNAENGYIEFTKNENELSNQALLKMSRFTKAMMQNINYEKCRNRRKENFLFFQEKLQSINELSLSDNNQTEVPMVYPLLVKHKTLRKELIQNRIYIASYWQDILNRCDEKSWEYYLAENLLPLPVDHRYYPKDLEKIVEIINGKL
ncbi:MAG: hypothetical protein ABIT08_00510 [Bacteroidia bacterium]